MSGALLFLASALPALARAQPAPGATGTVHYSKGAAWGTFEIYQTSSNAFGFWMRIRCGGSNAMTVVPSSSTSTTLTCWWIHYRLIGTTDPNRAEGWQWQETSAGRIVFDLSTGTGTSLDGQMAMFQEGTQNELRRPIPNPKWFGIRITVP